MRKEDLQFILDVLQSRIPKQQQPDWYSVIGYLEMNKIGASFLGCARTLKLELPQQVRQKLDSILYRQELRNRNMSAYIAEVSEALYNAEIEHVFIKGSILNYCIFEKDKANWLHNRSQMYFGKIYEPINQVRLFAGGERVSNDIDIMIKPETVGAAGRVLAGLGYKQGYWCREQKKCLEYDRLEIVKRRMNRGETAPYVKETGEGSDIPFIEIDINFSIDYLPTGNEELLREMLAHKKTYDTGIASLHNQYFFLHLIMHQYKEMALYSMVKRNKDNELYKYYDLYRFIKNDIIDFKSFSELIIRHGLVKECALVLGNTFEIFDSLETCAGFAAFLQGIKDKATDMVSIIDPENGNREYAWTIPIKERLCNYDNMEHLVPVEV